MNAVIGEIESAINWIIGKINNLLSGFNTVVQWAANVLGKDWKGVTLLQEVEFGRIGEYATGGFPQSGEVFLARENGIPEMVGSFGNRPMVANNNQIVEGIRLGVYDAVTKALANNQHDSTINVVLEGDAKGLFKAVRQEAGIYFKSTGSPAFQM